MFCDNNSNTNMDNCVIDETKNCANFTDFMNTNNQSCDNKCTKNIPCNNGFNFSGIIPIIVVVIIFILFFCNNKNNC